MDTKFANRYYPELSRVRAKELEGLTVGDIKALASFLSRDTKPKEAQRQTKKENV